MKKNAKAWTIDEDERLREMIASGASLTKIAKSLNRTESAIKTRAYGLGQLLGRVGLKRRGLSKWG